jgi:signal transduction histidine kinase
MPGNVRVALYRVAQEALNNAMRHAEAGKIDVRLVCLPTYARLDIEDDGDGFDLDETLQGQHLGLRIMRERADSIGASLEIKSRLDRGTRVSLLWQGH